MRSVVLFTALTNVVQASIAPTMADPATFRCPYNDSILSNQTQWRSSSPPGNWIGQGGYNVDAFKNVLITGGGLYKLSTITCRYYTDNDVKTNKNKGTKAKDTITNATGYVYIDVPYNDCKFSHPPGFNSSLCKGTSEDNCEITCQNTLIPPNIKCPDVATLLKSGPPPGWYWEAEPPDQNQLKSSVFANAGTEYNPYAISCSYHMKNSSPHSFWSLASPIPNDVTCSVKGGGTCWSPKVEDCYFTCHGK